jgi:2-octaprenyl-6-methoxyphenol hydroxylase
MQDSVIGQTQRPFDFLIAGAGAAGLSLAAALKQSLGRRASILVVDPAIVAHKASDRASALAAGSRRMFEQIGAWREIAPLAEPIREMAIMDGRVSDAVRPLQMHFQEADGEPLAHMAMNDDIVASLLRLCERLGVECRKASVADATPRRFTIEAWIDGAPVGARLLIAADGARSPLRGLAGIVTVGWDYRQSAIVATIGHERDHRGRAEQHFLPAGPFAVLPLPGRRSSIVWNESNDEAARLVALEPADFRRQLERRFTRRFGEIEEVSAPRAFQLGFRQARRFAGARLALVGDAAHVVHPLAGQGLNLALRDVATLAQILVETMRLGLDPGEPDALARYERARRFDAAASGFGMDAINRLFSNDIPPLRAARDIGLRLVDRTPALKSYFIKEAGGAIGAAPRLSRGLAI